jgi:hypothetical protein
VSDTPLIVVAADLNNNLVDGSVIWLRNVLLALTGNERRGNVVLLLHDTRRTDSLLFPPGQDFANTEILDPTDISRMDVKAHETLRAEQLQHVLSMIEARRGPVGGILVRGSAYAAALMASARFRGRTCVYTTERPSFASTRSSALERDIVDHARHVFVQSGALKRYYEVYLQARTGSVSVLPPMVETGSDSTGDAAKAPVVSYAGKLDIQYCVEDLVDLAPVLAAYGLRVQVVGNKFNRTLDDPQFPQRLRSKLEGGTAEWIPGATHEQSQRYMRAARFGFCVRSVALDNSVELSTKLLEYCAQGTPPIVRRTPQHVELFGADYPYYADSHAEVADLMAAHPEIDSIYRRVVERLRDVARHYDLAAVGPRLAPLYPRSAERRRAAGGSRPRMLLATHDDKFLVAALDRLVARDSVEVLRDPWASTQARPAGSDPATLPSADVVWCEWCCEQAVWWSRNKRPGQTLIVRLHRFEVFTPFPKNVDWSAVDHLVVVSDYFRRLAIEDFGAPERIVHVLPQYVDTAEFNRPKLPGADFTVGLVGVNAFSHKRPDRAVEFIEALARREPRFRLRVRSRMPWEFSWIWDGRPTERAAFVELFRRCLDLPLRDRVLFDRAGNDMPEWFRSVSVILSSSDSEGCHTSVAEGMASGCLPVCWAWPGAASVYGASYVHDSIDTMVEAALAAADRTHSAAGRDELKALGEAFDIRNTVTLMEELLP